MRHHDPSRPALRDVHGVEHRHGCSMPGWVSGSPRIATVVVVRCAGCGAVRLARARTTRPQAMNAEPPRPGAD